MLLLLITIYIFTIKFYILFCITVVSHDNVLPLYKHFDMGMCYLTIYSMCNHIQQHILFNLKTIHSTLLIWGTILDFFIGKLFNFIHTTKQSKNWFYLDCQTVPMNTFCLAANVGHNTFYILCTSTFYHYNIIDNTQSFFNGKF